MKVFQKVMNIISKVSEIICMVATAGLVVVIVSELINRNFFGSSFRASIEVCGILFLWMAFIGLIPLYTNNGLMRLDFMVSRIKNKTAIDVLTIFTHAAGIFLGVVMLIAYNAYHPYICNRYYATFVQKIPYTVQYLPMAIAGLYIAVNAFGNALYTLIGMFKKEGKEAIE